MKLSQNIYYGTVCLNFTKGRGSVDGECQYILLRDVRFQTSFKFGDAGNYLIINPCTGFIYSAMDPNCPLLDVYTLATPYNVWANIQVWLLLFMIMSIYINIIYIIKPYIQSLFQVPDKPHQLNFDIFDTKSWRPYFGSVSFPKSGIHTIQDPIKFVPTAQTYATMVEKNVLSTIRNNLRKWRSRRQKSTTTFHPEGKMKFMYFCNLNLFSFCLVACSIMSNVLQKFEDWMCNGDIDKNSTFDSSSTTKSLKKLNEQKRKREVSEGNTLNLFYY